MTAIFIGKNLHKKIVRPMKNSVKFKNKKMDNVDKTNKDLTNVIEVNTNNNEIEHKKENKKQKKDKEMVNENKLMQMEAIVNSDAPKANVKVEKADKGLYERTENSTILLTEDNKMLLND